MISERVFTDNPKSVGKSVDIDLIQRVLDKMPAWADQRYASQVCQESLPVFGTEHLSYLSIPAVSLPPPPSSIEQGS